MQRKHRLTGANRFSHIHQEGLSTANRHLVVRFLSNGLGHSRFGFLVSKRIGNAVVRNRVKRRLREAVRSARIKPGWDLVFIARRGAERATYQELKQAADSLLRHSRMATFTDPGDGPGPASGTTP